MMDQYPLCFFEETQKAQDELHLQCFIRTEQSRHPLCRKGFLSTLHFLEMFAVSIILYKFNWRSFNTVACTYATISVVVADFGRPLWDARLTLVWPHLNSWTIYQQWNMKSPSSLDYPIPHYGCFYLMAARISTLSISSKTLTGS